MCRKGTKEPCHAAYSSVLWWDRPRSSSTPPSSAEVSSLDGRRLQNHKKSCPFAFTMWADRVWENPRGPEPLFWCYMLRTWTQWEERWTGLCTCDRQNRSFWPPQGFFQLLVSTDFWLKSLASTSSLSYKNTTHTLRDHVWSLCVGISWIKVWSGGQSSRAKHEQKAVRWGKGNTYFYYGVDLQV